MRRLMLLASFANTLIGRSSIAASSSNWAVNIKIAKRTGSKLMTERESIVSDHLLKKIPRKGLLGLLRGLAPKTEDFLRE